MTREEYIHHLLQTYSLVSVLSQKNQGKVLRVRNKNNQKDMVVRSYPNVIPAYEELFSVESEHLSLVYDVISCDDGQIVLEEYVEGITVAQVMETGKYRYLGAKKVIKQICFALHILHSKGLVHRDIKPENVIISPKGKAVLVDMNAARKVSTADKDTVIMGTVGYASPEQLGITQSDPRTDIYALGILLNVMLTGKHPSEKTAKGKSGRIVTKCTMVNPEKRFQTVEKLIKAL